MPVSPDGANEVNSGLNDYGAWLTPDEKRIYFTSMRDGSGIIHLYTASREDRTKPFGTAQQVALSTHSSTEERPSLLSDESLLLFGSESTRQLYLGTAAGGFFAVSKAGQLGTGPDSHSEPYLSDDGELYFVSTSFYKTGIYRAMMARDGGVSAPAPVTELNVQLKQNEYPVRSADGLTLYLASDRDAGMGELEIYVTHRKKAGAPWDPPEKLPNVSTVPAGFDAPNWISPDGCRLYFHSARGDFKNRIYVVSRP